MGHAARIAVLLSALIALVSLPGCAALQPRPEASATPVPFDAVTRISYGRAGGLCAGYCVHRLDIDPKTITLTNSAMVNRGAFPDKLISRKMPESTWQALLKKVKWDAFKALPEKFGCPGCADGAYAWIEVERDGAVHKVTYETPSSLPEHTSLLQDVVALYEHLNQANP